MNDSDMKDLMEVFDKELVKAIGLTEDMVGSRNTCTATEVLIKQREGLDIIGWMPIRLRR